MSEEISKCNHPFSTGSSDSFLFDLFLCHEIPASFNDEISVKPGKETWKMPFKRNTLAIKGSYGMITDVPGYLNVKSSPPDGWNNVAVKQYEGFAIDLRGYENIDMYLLNRFSRKKRKNLRYRLNKLAKKERITYQFHIDELEWEAYLDLMNTFFEILKARFDQKKIYNRNLKRWPFLVKHSYQLLRDRRALLFIVSNETGPIAMSLNYLCGKIFFSFIQTFDPNYDSYGLGDICTLKKLEWCMENNYWIYDLSKGGNYFKQKWSNLVYVMNFNLLYKRRSLVAQVWRILMQFSLLLRQWLRDKGILGKWFQLDKFFYAPQRKVLRGFDWKQEIKNETGDSEGF